MAISEEEAVKVSEKAINMSHRFSVLLRNTCSPLEAAAVLSMLVADIIVAADVDDEGVEQLFVGTRIMIAEGRRVAAAEKAEKS